MSSATTEESSASALTPKAPRASAKARTNVLEVIEAANPSEADAPCSLSLPLNSKFVKVGSAGAMAFQKSDDPNALKISMMEDEDLKDTWAHTELLKRLVAR
jgi:hypothetical protein